MPPNFTGRKAELQTLSNWLQNDTQHPLFVLRALGGLNSQRASHTTSYLYTRL
jgi:hypothetical protein